ncbi:hypothetical protein ACFJIY_16420 [Pimelobacter simplex]|uniref:hypothetical protein n=1 Tax=Nocardioides simplex TaxID=2045 RepID=UPI00366ABDF4
MSALRTIGRFVRLEVQLYAALGRWLARRVDVPAGATGWGYSRMVTPVMWLWIFGSACELPIAHVLVPWEGVRIALLVVGVWGVVWMIGLLASLKVYPHLVAEAGLTVRYGKLARIAVPWTAIAEARYDDRDIEGVVRTLRTREGEAGTELYVPVNNRVNVVLVLAEPLPVPMPRGVVPAVLLGIWLDDPREFVAAARAAIASADSAGSVGGSV